VRASGQDHQATPQIRPYLDLGGERTARWRLAAERRAVKLESWIEQTLDEAADAILGKSAPASLVVVLLLQLTG
jgi:hypothetical protein